MDDFSIFDNKFDDCLDNLNVVLKRYIKKTLF